MLADRPNEDYTLMKAMAKKASGRPNKDEKKLQSYRDSTTSESGKTKLGSNHRFTIERHLFEHVSVSSPFSKGGALLKTANPYQRLKIEESIGVVRTAGKAVGYGSFVAHQSFSAYGGSYEPTNQRQLETAAIAKARTKFREEVQNANANLLLAIVERKEIFQTIHSLTWKVFAKLREHKNLVVTLMRIADEAKRRKRIKAIVAGLSVKGMSKTKDTFADLWLFFIYGIMPLVLDVQTMLKHIKKFERRQVHGRARKSFNESMEYAEGYWSTEVQKQGFVSCHVTGFVEVVDPLQKLLAEYGFNNIGLIIWERIPYSFLVDWVIGIGGWINSLGALDGTMVTSYNETVTLRSGMNLSNFQSIDSGGWTISSTIINPHAIFYETKSRVLFDKPPLPPMMFGSNMDWRRLLTSVSLLNQQIKKL